MTAHQKLLLQRHLKRAISHYRMLLAQADMGDLIRTGTTQDALTEALDADRQLAGMPTFD